MLRPDFPAFVVSVKVSFSKWGACGIYILKCAAG
jgi:hypothetical protein